jgi:transcriptional regulator with GAF, ATPase, and Fis domain
MIAVISSHLESNGGHKTNAARDFGLTREGLHKIIRRLNGGMTQAAVKASRLVGVKARGGS